MYDCHKEDIHDRGSDNLVYFSNFPGIPVMNSSTQVHAKLHKCHTMLSFHHIREAIAAGFLRFHFISSTQNPSDILTKPLDHSTAWPFVDTLLFRKGETMPSSAPHDQRGVSDSSDLVNLGTAPGLPEPQNRLENH